MSFLESLFGGLFGEDGEQEEKVSHPCSNCPSSCALAPDACGVCQPYKEQMIDAIYRVEHMDEIVSQYEVTGVSAQSGSIVCPHCGGHSENHYICDYCGSSLQEGGGKIQVASAADIPNPILEAQNIIFERQEAVREFTRSLSDNESGGFLSSLFDSLFGVETTEDSLSIGKKMTEGEIREMAEYFHVSVSDYLTGLDNGKYPTLSNKASYAQARENYEGAASSSQASSGDMLSGLAGLAGALGLGSAILGSSFTGKKPYGSSMQGGMNLFGLGGLGMGTGSQTYSVPTGNRPGQGPSGANRPPQQTTPVRPQQQAAPVRPQQQAAPVRPQQQAAPVRPQQQAAPVRPQQQATPVRPQQQAAPVRPQQQAAPVRPQQQAAPVRPQQQVRPVANKISNSEKAQKNAAHIANNMKQAAKAPKASAPKKPAGGKIAGSANQKPGSGH